MIIHILYFKPSLIIYEVYFNKWRKKAKLVMIEAKTHSCYPSVEIVKSIGELKEIFFKELEYFNESDEKFLIIKEGEVTKL